MAIGYDMLCLVLLAVNIIFVPRYGYIACAWAGVAGYATAMTLSYIVGQRKNPIRYPLAEMMAYVLLTTILFINGERLGIQVIRDEDAEANSDSAYFTSNDRRGDWDTAGAARAGILAAALFCVLFCLLFLLLKIILTEDQAAIIERNIKQSRQVVQIPVAQLQLLHI